MGGNVPSTLIFVNKNGTKQNSRRTSNLSSIGWSYDGLDPNEQHHTPSGKTSSLNMSPLPPGLRRPLNGRRPEIERATPRDRTGDAPRSNGLRPRDRTGYALKIMGRSRQSPILARQVRQLYQEISSAN
jgi:hypothetical protein